MAADLRMPLLAFACCRVYRRLESLSIDDDEGEVSMHACIHAWGIHKSVLQGQLPCMNMHFHTFNIIIPFPFNPLCPHAHTHHLFPVMSFNLPACHRPTNNCGLNQTSLHLANVKQSIMNQTTT